jgi:hypothetical protein
VFLTDVGAAVHGNTSETLQNKESDNGKFSKMFDCVFGDFFDKSTTVKLGKSGKAGGGGHSVVES